MAIGDPTWDLSENDCAALQAVLSKLEDSKQSLTRYGWHDYGCDALSDSGLATVAGQSCTCGFGEVLCGLDAGGR